MQGATVSNLLVNVVRSVVDQRIGKCKTEASAKRCLVKGLRNPLDGNKGLEEVEKTPNLSVVKTASSG